MKILLAALSCVLMGGVANATVTTNLMLGGGGGLLATNSIIINGNPLTDPVSGVSFTPTFQLTSVGGNLFQHSTGFGVSGAPGDNFINPTESVTLSYAGIVGGGTNVTFEGFTDATLFATGVPGESALLTFSTGSSSLTTDNPFPLGLDPGPLTLAGVSGALPFQDTSVVLNAVGVQFSAVSVPEPGSLAALGMLSMGVMLRRRR